MPPTPVSSAAPKESTTRRDLLADLATSTTDVSVPDWLPDQEPQAPEYARLRGNNEFGIDLSVQKPRAGLKWKALLSGNTDPGTRTLLMVGIAVGVVVVVLLIAVIALLLAR